ncbi:MAG: hypothetical protein K0R75_814, partial [Paenibacillaceae bacterium]|nr:hypothetical protein [Paenibacillaceae bacterium]
MWLRKAVVGLAALLLACPFGTVVVAEEFSTSASWGSGSAWTFVNPLGDATLDEAGLDDINNATPNHHGEVRFNVTASDDETATLDRAPRLLKDPLEANSINGLPNDDWVIETAIMLPPGDNPNQENLGGFYSSAANPRSHTGLLLWKSQSNWILWGPLTNSTTTVMGVINGVWQGAMFSDPDVHSYMRIKKRSNDSDHTRYYFEFSDNKYGWVSVGYYEDTGDYFESGAQYGLMAKSWGDAYRVQFPYFYDYIPENELDDFAALDPAFTVTSGPNSSATVNTNESGALELHVKAGDHYVPNNPNSNTNAPTVLKAVKYTDWIIDTMVTQRPTTASNDGLMVYLDNNNWIHFGQYYSSSQMVVSGTLNGTYSNNLGVSVSSLHDRIRIKKAGNVYTFQYSDDAIAWTTAGSWTDTNGNLAATSTKRQQYGFMASSIGSGTDFDVNFDFFREFMQPNGVVKEVTNASEIAQIIGTGSINAGHDINGADIGNMTEMNGNVYMMFGDNNGTVTAHRPNALAIGTDSTPSNGFTFDSVVDDANGNAVALISALNQDYVEKTNIPTAGVSVGSNLYYTYMSVYKWKDAPSHWDTNDTRIAVSTNGGQSFSKLTGASDPHWSPDSNFVQFAIAKDPNSVNDFVYFFGSSAGAFGDIKVFRVAEPNI